jgi:hypothetical protein
MAHSCKGWQRFLRKSCWLAIRLHINDSTILPSSSSPLFRLYSNSCIAVRATQCLAFLLDRLRRATKYTRGWPNHGLCQHSIALPHQPPSQCLGAKTSRFRSRLTLISDATQHYCTSETHPGGRPPIRGSVTDQAPLKLLCRQNLRSL